MKEVTIPVDAVVFREDLYPRMEKDPALVQRYAADLDVLPPIEVNQHNELIDGWHRWTGHKKNGADRIRAIITETRSEAEFLALAIRRNASHGKQLEDRDKRKMANRFIYDTVVNAIQQVKKRRQIVLITHNPNIPVLGEASQVYVLTSDGERASVANTGTVDDCKTEIVNLLEGGREAFDRRRERYGR